MKEEKEPKHLTRKSLIPNMNMSGITIRKEDVEFPNYHGYFAARHI